METKSNDEAATAIKDNQTEKYDLTITSDCSATQPAALEQNISSASQFLNTSQTIQHQPMGGDGKSNLENGPKDADSLSSIRSGQCENLGRPSSFQIPSSSTKPNSKTVPTSRKSTSYSKYSRYHSQGRENKSKVVFCCRSLEEEYPQIHKMIRKIPDLAGLRLRDIQPVVSLKRIKSSAKLTTKHARKTQKSFRKQQSSFSFLNAKRLAKRKLQGQHQLSPLSSTKKEMRSKQSSFLHLQPTPHQKEIRRVMESEFDDPFDFDLMSDLPQEASNDSARHTGHFQSTMRNTIGVSGDNKTVHLNNKHAHSNMGIIQSIPTVSSSYKFHLLEKKQSSTTNFSKVPIPSRRPQFLKTVKNWESFGKDSHLTSYLSESSAKNKNPMLIRSPQVDCNSKRTELTKDRAADLSSLEFLNGERNNQTQFPRTHPEINQKSRSMQNKIHTHEFNHHEICQPPSNILGQKSQEFAAGSGLNGDLQGESVAGPVLNRSPHGVYQGSRTFKDSDDPLPSGIGQSTCNPLQTSQLTEPTTARNPQQANEFSKTVQSKDLILEKNSKEKPVIVRNMRDPRQCLHNRNQETNKILDPEEKDANQTEVKIDSLHEAHQGIPDPPELANLNSLPKRKIAYGDYISKLTKNISKEDFSQQTDLVRKESVGLMTTFEHERKDASVQVNGNKLTKDPMHEWQKVAMKQSIVGALGAVISSLKGGMTVTTQITAILTIEKIMDIITRTGDFNLEGATQGDNSDAIVFLESGDKIITSTPDVSRNEANVSMISKPALHMNDSESVNTLVPCSPLTQVVATNGEGTVCTLSTSDDSHATHNQGHIAESMQTDPKCTLVASEKGKMHQHNRCEEPGRLSSEKYKLDESKPDLEPDKLDIKNKKMNCMPGHDRDGFREVNEEMKGGEPSQTEDIVDNTSGGAEKEGEDSALQSGNRKRKISLPVCQPEKRCKNTPQEIYSSQAIVVDSESDRAEQIHSEPEIHPSSLGKGNTSHVIPETYKHISQKRSVVEDSSKKIRIFEPLSLERSVVEDSSKKIKITLQKMAPADMKETIAVINKCLHGTEDEERRFVVLGGPLPTKDPIEDSHTSTELQSRTSGSTDSGHLCQGTSELDKASAGSKVDVMTRLQADWDLITSDEEEFDITSESASNCKKTCMVRESIKNNFENTIQRNKQSLRFCRHNFHQSNSDDNQSQEDHTKFIEQSYCHEQKKANSCEAKHCLPHPEPVLQMTSRKHLKQDPEGRNLTDQYHGRKTLLEMRLEKFYKFVASWRNGAWKNMEGLRIQATQWHKRLNKVKKNFNSKFEKRCRGHASSFQWDGETMTMDSANARLSELYIASVIANYVSTSAVYEETLKHFSSTGRRHERSQVQHILDIMDKILYTMESVQGEFGFTAGVGTHWLHCIADMRKNCGREVDTLKEMLEYKPDDHQYEEGHEFDQMASSTNNLKEMLRGLLDLTGCGLDSTMNETVSEDWEMDLPRILDHLDLENHPENLIDLIGKLLPGEDDDSESNIVNDGPFAQNQDHDDRAPSNSMGMWHRRLGMVADGMGRERTHHFSQSSKGNFGRSFEGKQRGDRKQFFSSRCNKEVQRKLHSEYNGDTSTGDRLFHHDVEWQTAHFREHEKYNKSVQQPDGRRLKNHADNHHMVLDSHDSLKGYDVLSGKYVHSNKGRYPRGTGPRKNIQKGNTFENQSKCQGMQEKEYDFQQSSGGKPWERYDDVDGREGALNEHQSSLTHEAQETELINTPGPHDTQMASCTESEKCKHIKDTDKRLFMEPSATVLPSVNDSIHESNHPHTDDSIFHTKDTKGERGIDGTKEGYVQNMKLCSKDAKLATVMEKEHKGQGEQTEGKLEALLKESKGKHAIGSVKDELQMKKTYEMEVSTVFKSKISFKLGNKHKVAEKNVFDSTQSNSDESNGKEDGGADKLCKIESTKTNAEKDTSHSHLDGDNSTTCSTLKKKYTNALLDIGIEYGNNGKGDDDVLEIISLSSEDESHSSKDDTILPKSEAKSKQPSTEDMKAGIISGKYTQLISRAQASPYKAHRAPTYLWSYIKHPKFKVTLCPHKTRCWRTDVVSIYTVLYHSYSHFIGQSTVL